MARYIDADKAIESLTELIDDTFNVYADIVAYQVREAVNSMPTADVREVMEADGYKHLICPHCLSEFYAKAKAEMFCPNCGKKIFFSEKWGDFPYKGENIPQGNGLP